MRELFGPDAAERARTLELPSEATQAAPLRGRALPRLRLPRLRLLVPVAAILLSGSGLYLGLASPLARRAANASARLTASEPARGSGARGPMLASPASAASSVLGARPPTRRPTRVLHARDHVKGRAGPFAEEYDVEGGARP
jgi:hypothetical protein